MGNDDDSGKRRAGGVGGWDLLVERAIKWLEIELHLQTVAEPQRLCCNAVRRRVKQCFPLNWNGHA